MEEQGKRERVMDNGDSHIAIHITQFTNTYTYHTAMPYKSNPCKFNLVSIALSTLTKGVQRVLRPILFVCLVVY